MSTFRIILGIIAFFGVFFFPWWITIALLSVGLLFVPYYWEFIVGIACIDVLYRSVLAGDIYQTLIIPLVVILVFAFVQWIRAITREYAFSS